MPPLVLFIYNLYGKNHNPLDSAIQLSHNRPLDWYTRKNAQLVINLQQTCSKSVGTTCWQDVLALVVPSLLTRLLQACSRLAYTSLMNSTALLQVVPTTCYRAASQQLVNKLWVTNLIQLDKITALLQLVDKLVYKLVAFDMMCARVKTHILSTSC